MRKLFTLVFVLISMAILAQNFGKVIIYTNTNQPFMVSLNGIRLSNQYAIKSTFEFAEENEYRTKVWIQGNQYPINFNIQSTPGYESTYQLGKDQYGAFTLNLISKVLIGANQPITTAPTVTPTPTPTPTTPVIVAMNGNEFNDKLNTVKNESFDDSKMDKAKFVFDDEYLSSAQVASVCKAFSFENRKVEFAKWAYKRTVDKKNYYKVVDVLTFDPDKRELQNWIKKNP
ncbi:MAG: DUF4476 domain-containing protein [Bacteroidetes bacterium]|nr:DUF4476 domain-containing protein [Bacteroidota bacterium]